MKFDVPAPSIWIRIGDVLMIPIMWLLAGFHPHKIQETHRWHTWRHLTSNDIDKKKALLLKKKDGTGVSKRLWFWFHVPILGGWKKYIVVGPKKNVASFRIGWAIENNGTFEEIAIHKLPIYNNAVRLLYGPSNNTVVFFAIDAEGKQIDITQKGSGTLGDNKYPGVRLF